MTIKTPEEQWREEFRRRFKEEITERPSDTSFLSMESFISSLLLSQKEALMRKAKEKLIEISEPHDGAKWYNTFTLEQILKALNEIEI